MRMRSVAGLVVGATLIVISSMGAMASDIAVSDAGGISTTEEEEPFDSLDGDPDPYAGTGQPEDATSAHEPTDLSFPEPLALDPSTAEMTTDGLMILDQPAETDGDFTAPQGSNVLIWNGDGSLLTEEIKAELRAAGIDPESLGGTPSVDWIEPSQELIEKAGDCPMKLGDNYLDRLRECAVSHQ